MKRILSLFVLLNLCACNLIVAPTPARTSSDWPFGDQNEINFNLVEYDFKNHKIRSIYEDSGLRIWRGQPNQFEIRSGKFNGQGAIWFHNQNANYTSIAYQLLDSNPNEKQIDAIFGNIYKTYSTSGERIYSLSLPSCRSIVVDERAMNEPIVQIPKQREGEQNTMPLCNINTTQDAWQILKENQLPPSFIASHFLQQ